MTLDYDEAKDSRLMIVNKYLGMDDKVGLEIAFDIQPKVGILEGARAGRPSTTLEGGQGRAPVPRPDGRLGYSQDGGLRFSADTPRPDGHGVGNRQQDGVGESRDIW